MNRPTGMRRAAIAVLTIVSMAAVTACQGAFDLPLPGGAAGGSEPSASHASHRALPSGLR